MFKKSGEINTSNFFVDLLFRSSGFLCSRINSIHFVTQDVQMSCCNNSFRWASNPSPWMLPLLLTRSFSSSFRTRTLDIKNLDDLSRPDFTMILKVLFTVSGLEFYIYCNFTKLVPYHLDDVVCLCLR